LRTEGFKGMPYAEALPIISGMSKALAYAHERGFVHCDFKPANVFLTASGDVKVIDFGIARLIPKPEEEVEATVFDPGSLGGMTPAYASPEMLEHGEPDPRDDIYALACITYELLSGHHPFDRLPANQARGKRMRPERPSGLGRRQWQALRAALSFERGTRTPTVARFIHGMSGERPAGAHLVGAGAALLLAVLVAATIAHYQPFANHQGGEPTTAAPQTPLATVQPTATPGVATPASVASILASVPCSLLRASERDNTLLVRGYLPRYFGIPRLKEMLSAAPGVSHLDLDVRQVSDDDCGVITALAPYWSRNQEDGSATSIRPRGRNAELSEGDSLILDITTPPYDAYVNVDYYVLDGSVVHLLPSPRAKDNQTPPSYAATLGSLGNWIVSKPFGSELIVLLVTPVPLFDGIRPEHESRSNYLEAIEKRLGQIASKYGPEHITADFVLLTTKPKP
jgi:serine/threonine protein kinase